MEFDIISLVATYFSFALIYHKEVMKIKMTIPEIFTYFGDY